MWLPGWTGVTFAERFAELLPKQLLKQHVFLTSFDVLEPEKSTLCLSTRAVVTMCHLCVTAPVAFRTCSLQTSAKKMLDDLSAMFRLLEGVPGLLRSDIVILLGIASPSLQARVLD